MPKLADEIWADGPTLEPHQPLKSDIREWGHYLENYALPKLGGTLTGPLNIDNGTNIAPDFRPVVSVAGLLSFFGDQVRFWPDLDGDGDYDGDMVYKGNAYHVPAASFQIIPGKDLTEGVVTTAPGRHVFRANDVANYYQSGGNYSGSWFKDLIITRYNTAAPWMIFDESQGGRVGIGSLFPTAPETVNGTVRQLYQVGARLHVIDAAQRVALIESTSTSNTARLGFKDPTTTVEPTIGSAGDELLFRTDNVSRVRIGSTGIFPSVDNTSASGGPGARWSAVWSATGTIQTSDERTKIVEERIAAADALLLVNEIEPALFRYKIGSTQMVSEPDGFEEILSEDKVMAPINAEGRDLESASSPEVLEEKIVRRVVRTPKFREVAVDREGSRVHAGFLAQNVKAGLDRVGKDLALWGLEDKNDPESTQFIRPDQMTAILWAAVRGLHAEIEVLKGRSHG